MALVVVSCGGHDGVAPPLPTGSSVAPSSSASDPGFVMESSQGIAPAGFKFVSHLDPKPDEDGIVHGKSPITVDVDLCNSTVEPGKTAHFLFDWDFNNRPEIVGTGDACHQKHTYRLPADSDKGVTLESNVCVTNGDPTVHDGSTYFSCRTIRVQLPKTPEFGIVSANCATGAPAGCLPAEGGFSLLWPGGLGPHGGVLAFGNPTCQGVGSPAPFPVALACDPFQAEEVCDGDFFGPLTFVNGDVALVACGDFGPTGAPSFGPARTAKPWSVPRGR